MRVESATLPGLDEYLDAVREAFHVKADIALEDEFLQGLAQEKAAFGRVAAEQLAKESSRVLGRVPRGVAILPRRGTFHAVFRIELTAAEICYARTGLPSVPWPALEFVVSKWASAELPRYGVPVMETLHIDLSRTRVPFDLEITRRAEGLALEPGPESVESVRRLGVVVARFHAVCCRGFGQLDPRTLGAGRSPAGVHESWKDYVLLRLDEHLSACLAEGAVTSPEAVAIRSAFREAEPLLSEAPSVLLHGDLGSQNVLVDAGRISALLDWEDSLVGDPVFDIAGWGTFVGHHQRLDAFLDGYRTKASPPADFELRYWLYYLRIMLAKTVHRRRFGYSRTDRIPAAERLRPALDALTAHLGEGC